MKPTYNRQGLRSSAAVCASILGISVSLAEAQSVTIDGAREANEAYVERSVQTLVSNWDTVDGVSANSIANLHTTQSSSELFISIAGHAQGNAVILFIDSKAGGVSFIPNNLITSGGEEWYINNLGNSASGGLTFEAGFTPDYALRIFGTGSDAHVNRYNLTTGVRSYAGNSGPGNPMPVGGIINGIKTLWEGVPAAFSEAILGVEMSLSLAQLGVPNGEAQPIKLMAMLVNGASNYASNQVLGALTSSTADIGGAVNSFNFEAEPGSQTISLTVDYTDTDGDGISDALDDDDDGDGLLDGVETNTGIYVSAEDSGTNPLLADTDGDGFSDGEELTSALGYISNPTIANYQSMAVPGSYTDPAWQVDGSAGNAMIQGDTSSLTGQYEWTLDYRFNTVAGAITYKYAANGNWTNSWGDGGVDIGAAVGATGFYRFTFNNATLARSFGRTEFPDVAAFLTAYGVLSGEDSDQDGLNNEDEFLANTDPTQADTDGDGVNDDLDPLPLSATRDIVFSVNMSVQEALGNFDPLVNTVVVDFFTGLAGTLPDLVLSPVGEGIWTGTLVGFEGPASGLFGTYKFRHNAVGAADGGYEGAIGNREFSLEVASSTQTLATVFFNDNSTMPVVGGFVTWSTTYAGGQGPDLDFDGDGVKNGVEYFMGETSAAFTANPSVVNGSISWPRDASATGVTYKIWTSDDLSTWADVTASAIESEGLVSYTLPTTTPKRFVRLEVIVEEPVTQ
ncbi:MAG: hypothetical protein RLZZ245_1197 [Verrucomicrobiota bacterium]